MNIFSKLSCQQSFGHTVTFTQIFLCDIPIPIAEATNYSQFRLSSTESNNDAINNTI